MRWWKNRATVLLSAALAQAAAAQDVSAIAAALAADPAIPGAAVGWVEPQDFAFAVAGLRVAEAGAPVERDDLWHVGSLTKSMTALLAARLVAADDVGWDTALSTGGPTLSALLTHRSGMPANPPVWRMLAMERDWSTPQGPIRAELTAGALSARRQDRGFLYSNLGYIAAGQMLAETRGLAWEALIRQEVFAPLGMESAGFGPPGRDGTAAPWGHTARGNPVDPARPMADNPPAFGPAGTVHLSTQDMLIYLQTFLIQDPAYLPSEAWDRLLTPPNDGDYAMGWVQRADGTYWHNGSNTLWYAEAAFDLEAGRAAFVAVNAGDVAAVQGAVADALSALLAQ